LGGDSAGFDETGEALNFLRRLFCGLHREYRYENAVFGFRAKLNFSWNECEQRVVFAHADIGAGVTLRAALAHDNVAGENLFPAIAFHAEPATR
jgi:hypothetical protein